MFVHLLKFNKKKKSKYNNNYNNNKENKTKTKTLFINILFQIEMENSNYIIKNDENPVTGPQNEPVDGA